MTKPNLTGFALARSTFVTGFICREAYHRIDKVETFLQADKNDAGTTGVKALQWAVTTFEITNRPGHRSLHRRARRANHRRPAELWHPRLPIEHQLYEDNRLPKKY